MKLSSLPRLTGRRTKAKRIGRGYGSGKGGHTVGKGAKGQKVRNKIRPYFEGGQVPMVKRLPRLSRFRRYQAKAAAVKLEALNSFPAGTIVTPQELLKAGVISSVPVRGVKVIASSGVFSKKIQVSGCKCSAKAKQLIEQAGGSVA